MPPTMAKSRRPLLLVSCGLFIGSLVGMVVFSRHDIPQKEREEIMDNVQMERKQLIKEMCDRDKSVYLNVYVKDRDPNHNLLVDETNGLIYCYVPKVACSNLKRIMLTLMKGEPYDDPQNITGNVHKKLPRLSMFPRAEIKAKLEHYTKFLFVRDPLVRLISAYRDKIEQYNEPFYSLYGRKILYLYDNLRSPPKTIKEAIASGIHTSFHSFMKYLLDPRTERMVPFEPHWRQMYRLCHPCLIEYDFIGHQETLQEDVQHLLRLLKIKDDIKIPPSNANVTSFDDVLDLFGTLPLNARMKVYKLYERDFQLFGYRTPGELFETQTMV